MKQLYYGNDYHNGGYQILACSEGIPKNAQEKMIKCAEGITDTQNGDFGLAIYDNMAILYNNSIAQPRTNFGEQRGTYFSHLYYIDPNEFDSFMENMPSAIENAFFATDYLAYYDISDVTFAYSTANQLTKTKISNIVSQAIKTGCKIIIYGSNISKENVKEFIVKTTQGLEIHERKHISFVHCGSNKDTRLQTSKIIFCNPSIFADLQEKFYKKCVYLNVDTSDVAYSSDLKQKSSPPIQASSSANSVNIPTQPPQPVQDVKQNQTAPHMSPTEPQVSNNPKPHIQNSTIQKKTASSASSKVLISISIFLSIVSIFLSVFSIIQNNKLTKNNESLVKKHAAFEQTIQAEVDEFKTSVEDKYGKIASLEESLDGLKENNGQTTENTENNKNAINELDSKLSTLKNEIEDLKNIFVKFEKAFFKNNLPWFVT